MGSAARPQSRALALKRAQHFPQPSGGALNRFHKLSLEPSTLPRRQTLSAAEPRPELASPPDPFPLALGPHGPSSSHSPESLNSLASGPKPCPLLSSYLITKPTKGGDPLLPSIHGTRQSSTFEPQNKYNHRLAFNQTSPVTDELGSLSRRKPAPCAHSSSFVTHKPKLREASRSFAKKLWDQFCELRDKGGKATSSVLLDTKQGGRYMAGEADADRAA